MDHFAGLDVSVKETSVCIVDDTGNRNVRLYARFVVQSPCPLYPRKRTFVRRPLMSALCQ
jgi:hypothetical protein